MSNVPPSKREQYLANSGIELKSDDTQFDVAAWRETQEAKLAEIDTVLDTIKTVLDTIETNTDGVEGLISTSNTKLTEIDTVLDTMDGRLAALNSDLDEVETKLDTINTTLGGTLITRDRVHQHGHDGKLFMGFHNSSSLGSGSTINVFLETPASPQCHLLFNVTGSDAFDFEVLEAPTVTSNTGAHNKEAFNKNRTSATASTIQDNATSPNAGRYSTDVTVTADGTVLVTDVFGSNKSGGDYSLIRELILKASTKYVFRLTSRAAGNRVHINLDWYEST